METKKQTAIEWLIEQMKKGEVAYGMFHIPGQTDVFEQAKQMEKEQITNAHFDSSVIWNNENGRNAGVDYYELKAEQYYNEIYKKQVL